MHETKEPLHDCVCPRCSLVSAFRIDSHAAYDNTRLGYQIKKKKEVCT